MSDCLVRRQNERLLSQAHGILDSKDRCFPPNQLSSSFLKKNKKREAIASLKYSEQATIQLTVTAEAIVVMLAVAYLLVLQESIHQQRSSCFQQV